MNLALFSSHTKIKSKPDILFYDDLMWKTPKAKTTFESSVFRRLEKFGGRLTGSRLLSERFDSTQWGTSYDLRKTHLASLEGGGSFVSGSCPHTRKKKKCLPVGAFHKL